MTSRIVGRVATAYAWRFRRAAAIVLLLASACSAWSAADSG
ncbi:hypothetical protein [Amycolatopsis rubida]|uniref:Uncharacterized protein n=1 Tax=Amycolatopsis rubida TaxID=112413 RepID=A0A1I5XFJ7_9PSEU|nr:hypothetical protein [Amycolatopsis rubida]SFQ30730.1 hypothetical protein SAMN05421854_110198 [Amycolatopsis rubida]